MILAGKIYRSAGKRIFDVVVSLFLLLLLSPLILGLWMVIRASLGKPGFFIQERPGYRGRIFKIYKFRTMKNSYGAAGNLRPDHERMTTLGDFLRKSSLDELPELFNVLAGDMSLVGPRPLLKEYLDRYTEAQARRHFVKPGITGLVQIAGRNQLKWKNKFRLDTFYAERYNFLLDLKILLSTSIVVFKREGIHAEGHETMPEFLGEPPRLTNCGRELA